MFAGTFEMTGGFVSWTVTVSVPLPTLPAASFAEQVTVVAPIGNVEPDAGEQVGVNFPLTRSVAVAVNVTAAPFGPLASTVTDVPVTVGGVVSRTVTVNVPVPVFPAASFAVHVTVVVPSANCAPEAGVHDGVSVPLTRSVAVAVNVAAAPFG